MREWKLGNNHAFDSIRAINKANKSYLWNIAIQGPLKTLSILEEHASLNLGQSKPTHDLQSELCHRTSDGRHTVAYRGCTDGRQIADTKATPTLKQAG